MNFEVGDHVIVRDWGDMEEEYGLNHRGSIECCGCFTPEMRRFCDMEFIVSSAHSNITRYVLKEISTDCKLPWWFSDDMLKPVNYPREEAMFDSSWVDEMLLDASAKGCDK